MSAASVRSADDSDALAIDVRGLRKSYGENEVVRGIDLEVRHGEVFAFLGPNGAGKTTTVEILEGYRSRNAGEVSVLGIDPAAADRQWRSRVGLVLQSCTMPAELTVREFVGALRRLLPASARAGRVDRARRPDGPERHAHEPALRWPAAPPRCSAGPDRRSGAGVPRRADDGLRPIRSSPRVGGDREPAEPGQDDLPDHPLHGRGAGPRRPCRGNRRGRDRGRGDAGDARRTRPGDERRRLQPSGGRQTSLGCRPTSSPSHSCATAVCTSPRGSPRGCCTALSGWALSHGR